MMKWLSNLLDAQERMLIRNGLRRKAHHFGWKPARDGDGVVFQLLDENKQCFAIAQLDDEALVDLSNYLDTRLRAKPDNFVQKGTRAWDAWKAFQARARGSNAESLQ